MKLPFKPNDSLAVKRRKFLEDTVNYYSEDVSRRATNKAGKCVYLNSEGNNCAIGRYIEPNNQEALMFGGSVYRLLIKHPTCLPKEIIDLGENFLTLVQNLHDSSSVWLGDEAEGKRNIRMEYILNNYCNDTVTI